MFARFRLLALNVVENQRDMYGKPTKHGSASDVVHRIVPLGLTLGEARAWYLNRVVIPRIRWALAALAGGLIILTPVMGGFGFLLEETLTTRIFVHDASFLAAGFLFASAVLSMVELSSRLSDRLWFTRKSLAKSRFSAKWITIASFAAAALIIAYWYIPAEFVTTATSVGSNTRMSVAFLFAGGLTFVGSSFLTRRVKLIGLVVVGKVLGLYGMFLILTPWAVYPTYPLFDQVYAGAALLFLMLILDFTVMPLWLYNYFVKSSRSHVTVQSTAVA